MTADDTSQAEAGSWLPIPEAAKYLGIHVRTVHRWIDIGQLMKRDVGRGRVEVWCPEHLAAYAPPESTPATPQGTSLAAMSQHLALMERLGEISAQQMAPLLAELAATRQQMAAQAEEIGRLKAELKAEIERQMAPGAVPDTRPWWRFWGT